MGHLELNDEYKLMTNGFVIYRNHEKEWILKKIQTKDSTESIEKIIFESYEKAKAFALNLLNNKDKWTAIVRYDRGLGIEYKNIDNIHAKTLQEANEIAYKEILSFLHDKNMIKEIKLKNKN